MLVAAEPREFDGLLPFCSGVRKLAATVRRSRKAILAAMGMGISAGQGRQ